MVITIIKKRMAECKEKASGFDENELVLTGQPDKEVVAVYRGWMMRPDRYRDFQEALLRANIRLVIVLKEYEAMYLFPNAYP